MRERLTLRSYMPGDEDRFELRADFAQDRLATGWDWTRGAPGSTWTLMRGADVLGVGGYVRTCDGHIEAWAQTADMSPREWLQAAELARIGLDLMLVPGGAATRIYAAARCDRPGAVRLLQRLGFRVVEAQCFDPRLPDVPFVQLMRSR